MDYGILYSHQDSGRFLGVELLGCVVFIAWSGIFTAIFFGIAKAFGVLRLTETEELIGTDLTYFGPIQMEKFPVEIEMKFSTEIRQTERKGSNDEIVKD
jgi:ammonia channel protein AmtB